MRVSEASLQSILKEFDGRLVTPDLNTGNKAFSLAFFIKNVDPSFHADMLIDVTQIENNHSVYYKNKNDQQYFNTFNMFILFNLIKTIEKDEFRHLRYRFINNQWYCFNNLPLLVSVKVDDPKIQQVFFFIKNVRNMDWDAFIKTYNIGVTTYRQMKSDMQPDDISWYNVAYLMTSMLFDFSSYTPSQKCDDLNAHAPWFVFSKRRKVEDKTFITLSCHTSHASFLPLELDKFVKSFEENATSVPENQRITHYFKVQF